MGVGATVLSIVIWPYSWWWCHSALSSSYGPGAPAIHPTSSSLLAWQPVLHRPLLVVARCWCSRIQWPWHSPLLSRCHGCGSSSSISLLSPASSTRHPPHEQLLMGLLAAVGIGGGSVLSWDSVWGCRARQCNMACVQGLLCAYQAGIPLLGSPGIPLHHPIQCQQPHIPFEWGGGGLGSCAHVLCIVHHCRSLEVEYNLKISQIQSIN